MATFPGGIWGPSTKVDGVDYYLAAHMNDAQNEIVAIETEILTPVQGGRPNLLYDTLTHDIWRGGTTFTDFGDDTYTGGTLWNGLHNGQAPQSTRQAGASTDPFTHHARITFDSASSQAGYVQFLSAADSKALRGKTVSLSADVWGTAVTNIRMSVLQWASTSDAVTSDVVSSWAAAPTLATNWSHAGTPASIPITSTRTRYAVQNLTLNSTLNNLAVFIWTPDSEANGDLFNLARVKLEIGTTATNFIARLMPEEEQLISTFFYSSNPAVYPPPASGHIFPFTAFDVNQAYGGRNFGVVMRTTPTVTVYDSVGNANAVNKVGIGDVAATVVAANISAVGFSRITKTSAFTAGQLLIAGVIADARL